MVSDYVFNYSETPKNPSISTPFTFFHFVTGMLAFVVLSWLNIKVEYGFVMWMTVHTIYEFKDVTYPNTKNSLTNSLGDTAAAALGFMLMWWVIGDKRLKFYDVLNAWLIMYIILQMMEEPDVKKVQKK